MKKRGEGDEVGTVYGVRSQDRVKVKGGEVGDCRYAGTEALTKLKLQAVSKQEGLVRP